MPTTQEPVNLQFTEEMKGYITLSNQVLDYKESFESGKKEDNYFMFHLTIIIPDVEFFVNDPKETGIAEGYVECPKWGGKLTVEKGVFNCFVDVDAPIKNTKNMFYRLFFKDNNGKPLTMSGHKVVKDDSGIDIWKDTTTLYTRIYEGHIEEKAEKTAKLVATGILEIYIKDFAKQMTTIKSNGKTFSDRENAVMSFGKLFLGNLWDVYGAKLKSSEPEIWNQREIPMFTLSGVADGKISYHPISTGDKLGISLMRFKKKESDDVILLSHGLTTSTDMYIMPEHNNLVNYLHANGYGDIWSLDWRGSMRHSYNLFPHRFNLDDVALYDLPAAIAEIRKHIGPKKRIHAIVHCVGSITFMMSLFSKKIDGITSVISNSVSLNPRVATWSKMKLAVAPFAIEYLLRFPNVNPRSHYNPGPALGKLLSSIVSLFHRECNNPACHMLSMMWGTGFPACYEHSQLAATTHNRVGDLFGATSMNYHRHIRRMVSKGYAVKYQIENKRYAELPNNYLDNAKDIDTPILFMTGDKNRVFNDSNIVTYETLKKLKPDNKNELFIAKGYGHQDTLMGKNVDKDIFPQFIEFIKKHQPKQKGWF
ncbi:MAG: alpha/beta fold hydrolase [Leptospiraceae bacterium]|nr:alpha/beta fold hydrolase [Leptospiraceae bacterium]